MLKKITVTISTVATLLCGCQVDDGVRSRLKFTWACDGKDITEAGETYTENGEYLRFERQSAAANKLTTVLLSKGQYRVQGSTLFTWIQPAESKMEVAKVTAEYKIHKVTPTLLELEYSGKSAFVGKVRTCRKVSEELVGEHYAKALRDATILEKKQLNKLPDPQSTSAVVPADSAKNIKVKSNSVADTSSTDLKKRNDFGPPTNLVENPLPKGLVNEPKDEGKKKEESKKVKSQIVNSTEPATTKKTVTAPIDKMLADIQELDRIKRRNHTKYEIFKSISASLTPRLQILSIHKKYASYTLKIQTHASSRVAHFVRNLKRSAYVGQVNLVANAGDKKRHIYTLTFVESDVSQDYSFIRLNPVSNPATFSDQQRQELQALQGGLYAKYADERIIKNVIKEWGHLAKQKKWQITFSENEQVENQDLYTKHTVHIKGIVDYHGLLLYLNNIARMRHPSEIVTLSLTPQDRDYGDSLRLEMDLVFYRYPNKINPYQDNRISFRYQTLQVERYPALALANHEYLMNPFIAFSGEVRSPCDGPLNDIHLRDVPLVSIIKSPDPVALFRAPDGALFRAKNGGCIAKDTQIRSITESTVKLKRILYTRFGRRHSQELNVRLK